MWLRAPGGGGGGDGLLRAGGSVLQSSCDAQAGRIKSVALKGGSIMTSRFLSLQCLASDLEEGSPQPYSPIPVSHPAQRCPGQPPVQGFHSLSYSRHPNSLMGGKQSDGSEQLASSNPQESACSKDHSIELQPTTRPQHPKIPNQNSNHVSSYDYGDQKDVLGPLYSNEGTGKMLRSPGSNSTKSSVSQESGVASGSEEEEVKYKEAEYKAEEAKINECEAGNVSSMEGGKYNVRSERLICQRWWGRPEETEVFTFYLSIITFHCLTYFTKGAMFSMWCPCPKK